MTSQAHGNISVVPNINLGSLTRTVNRPKTTSLHYSEDGDLPASCLRVTEGHGPESPGVVPEWSRRVPRGRVPAGRQRRGTEGQGGSRRVEGHGGWRVTEGQALRLRALRLRTAREPFLAHVAGGIVPGLIAVRGFPAPSRATFLSLHFCISGEGSEGSGPSSRQRGQRDGEEGRREGQAFRQVTEEVTERRSRRGHGGSGPSSSHRKRAIPGSCGWRGRVWKDRGERLSRFEQFDIPSATFLSRQRAGVALRGSQIHQGKQKQLSAGDGLLVGDARQRLFTRVARW